jgi:hypothetical protein
MGRADLEEHRFHDLRHTFGTRMAAAGVPLRTLQDWMGHRDITTTQRYADYAPSEHEGEMAEAAFARSHGHALRWECPVFCVGIDREEIDVDDNHNQVGRGSGSRWERQRGAERARRASAATRWRCAPSDIPTAPRARR